MATTQSAAPIPKPNIVYAFIIPTFLRERLFARRQTGPMCQLFDSAGTLIHHTSSCHPDRKRAFLDARRNRMPHDLLMNHVPLAPGIRNICVYCGSGSGRNPAFAKAARDFGRILAENRIGLVYGGGGPWVVGGSVSCTTS